LKEPTNRSHPPYSSIPGHRNWQIETAVWNLAGFLHYALETRWQRFEQFLNDLSNDFYIGFPSFNVGFQKNRVRNPHKITILVGNRDRNRDKSRGKSNKKSLTTKFEFLLEVQKFAGWGSNFLIVYRNNAGRLGLDSSVCAWKHAGRVIYAVCMSRDATVRQMHLTLYTFQRTLPRPPRPLPFSKYIYFESPAAPSTANTNYYRAVGLFGKYILLF